MLVHYLKAFHIIGFVAWFAGLFYLVRLFVYHKEAIEKDDNEVLRSQYHIMESRLLNIITVPALVFTWSCGLGMIYLYGWAWFSTQKWLLVKLLFLIILSSYTFYCYALVRSLYNEQQTFSSRQFRMFNEIPTLLLVIIVLIAVLKSELDIFYSILGFVVFGAFLFVASKLYQRHLREL